MDEINELVKQLPLEQQERFRKAQEEFKVFQRDPDALDRSEAVLEASVKFQDSEAFREFVSSPMVASLVASLMSAAAERNPLFNIDKMGLTELVYSTMVLTVVMWEDQPLEEPK